MKRIIIICEGETEQEFCDKILYPYFLEKQIDVSFRNIEGIKKWNFFKKLIENELKEEKSAFLTTFIDFYGIQKGHSFPSWNESLSVADKNSRMDFLETKMKNDIDNQLNFRFIPYIQLHEFEGLLFNDIEIFYNVFTNNELVGKDELGDVFRDFSNPEMINDSKETAPSKRLLRIIPSYDKIVYGSILAENIGLQNIRNKCPRFNAWIEKLEIINDKHINS